MDNIHFRNSPLVEVSFYAECVPSVLLDDEKAKFAQKKLLSGYQSDVFPESRVRRVVLDDPQERERWVIVAENKGERVVIIFKSNLFSYTYKGVYDSWENYIERAKVSFHDYLAFLKPLKVNRLGVRNINEICNLPFSSHPTAILVDLPHPRDGLKTVPVEYMVRDRQYYPDYDLFSTVLQTERLSKDEKDVHWRATVDIDVFAMNKEGLDLSEIDVWLERMRTLKNAVFVRAFHKEILELFK